MRTQKKGRLKDKGGLYWFWRLFIYPWKFFTLHNFRILVKAIQREPPSLIFENLRLMLRRGQSQSAYPNKFIAEDPDLKVFLMDCRKEAGILKVLIWVLARKGLNCVSLSTGDKTLPVRPESFINPELSAFFSAYNDFEQKGCVLQLPFNEPFETLQLQLTDLNNHQFKVSIGAFFQYEEVEPEDDPNPKPNPEIRMLVVLHDWERAKGLEKERREENLRIFAKMGWEVITCREQGTGASDAKGVKAISYDELNDELLGTELDHKKEVESHDAKFDYLLLLSVDTILPSQFCSSLAHFLEGNPKADLLYFDEDIQSSNGKYHSPSLKPALSPEYLAADNYIGSNYCIKADVGEKLGWFSTLDFRSGGYHFLLRALDYTENFARLPDFRLHRQEQATACFTGMEVGEIQARTEYFSKKGFALKPGLVPGTSEVLRLIHEEPLVSIIIPFKDQQKLLEQSLNSVFSKTQYANFEVILISNNSREERTYEYLEEITQQYPNVRWYRRDHVFNYSQLNNWGAQQANGALLLLLNNDVEVITRGWITKMVSYFLNERVGAVGTKLLYPDHTVQHAGIVTGIGGIAGHIHKHYPGYFGGYNGRANKVQNMSACTAACLMIRHSVFDKVEGLNEKHLPVAFNDVDLCLKIHAAGYRIVYTPFVKLFHFESISRGAEDTPEKRKRAKREVRFFRKQWKDFIKKGDPYYHPDLSKRMGHFEDKRIFGI